MRPADTVLVPEWAAPPCVGAVQALRGAGMTAAALRLPAEPSWLTQVHGTTVAYPERGAPGGEADAAVTREPGTVLAVKTADCLPVLFADRAGTVVAAAHAGWRGLAAGVLEAAIAAMETPMDGIVAWLGPAIGQRAFEVGPEVRDAFVANDAGAADAFVRGAGDRWHADLAALARRRLALAGVTEVAGGHWCTYSDPARFHSYRRDRETGRMAALVWIRT